MGFRILADVSPTSAQNYTLQFGLMDVAGTSYVWFDARFNVSSLIRGQTALGGTPTSTATTAFAGGTFNRYKILINAAWTSVSFFINNVLLGSAITTTIPTAIKMYPGVVLLKTVGPRWIASDVDQFYLNYQYVS